MDAFCPKCQGNLHKKGRQTPANGGKQRWKCNACGYHGGNPVSSEKPKGPGIIEKKVDGLERFLAKRGKKRLVVTAAQNATKVHPRFLLALENYCLVNDAQLVVIPFRYRNPTAWSTVHEDDTFADDEWWAKELQPHLFDRRVRLNEHLELLADIKTQPTAARPLSGFETITGARSGILGHPKLELDTIPTPAHRLPKILTTTGAVTERNYIDGKAGKKGEFHHTFGACVVEIEDDKTFHLRQINAMEDGSFCELGFEYQPDETTPRPIAGVVLGDWHEEFTDKRVEKATFLAADSIVATLKPDYCVWHDLHDFYSRNHHHRNDPVIAYRKHKEGSVGNVADMLSRTAHRVADITAPWPQMINVIVPSNHPDAIARWVKETDPREDPENAIFWCETYKAMLLNSRWGKAGVEQMDPFVFWMKSFLQGAASRFRFIGRDESFEVQRIEVGYHGDRGPNGARGSRNAFGKIGAKSIIGHGHSPGVRDGVYQVGTSSVLGLEYVSGPSSWLHTHCLIYSNGKRSLVNIIDGKWRMQ